MLSKRGISGHGAGSGGSSSPVHTPGTQATEVGGGTTPYTASTATATNTITASDRKEESDCDDSEGRGYLRREESEIDTSVGADVELRSVSEMEGDQDTSQKTQHNRRLTLLQLERFRRAIAASKGKRVRRTSSSQWDRKVRRGEAFTSVFTENPEGAGGVASSQELRIVSYPWAMWVLSALLVIAASVFVDQVHKEARRDARLAKAEATVNWWKYLVAGIVYVLAAAVLLNGRVETFIMNKELGLLSIRSTKPLCVLHKLRRTRVVEKDLHMIIDVRVEATGEILSGEVDTRAYKVHFDFDDGTHTTTLEGRSKKKALVRCRLIKQFLLSCAPPSSPGALDSPLSGSGSSTSGGGSATLSPQALSLMPPTTSMTAGILLPPRGASSNLSLAVPVPLSMSAAAATSNGVAPSPRRIMMVAAVPSTLSQKSVQPPGQGASVSPSASTT